MHCFTRLKIFQIGCLTIYRIMPVFEVIKKNPVTCCLYLLHLMLQDGETAINMEAARFMAAAESFVQPLRTQ